MHGTFVMLALALVTGSAACSGGRATNEICEARAACDVEAGRLDPDSEQAQAEACANDISSGVRDGRYDPDDVKPCAECLKDSSCAEIDAGDCESACGTI